jgi:hypothetical protein
MRFTTKRAGTQPPVFFGRFELLLALCSKLKAGIAAHRNEQTVDRDWVTTLSSMERSAGGLLRVTIDLPWQLRMPSSSSTSKIAKRSRASCSLRWRSTRCCLQAPRGELAGYRPAAAPRSGFPALCRLELIDITLKAPIGCRVRRPGGPQPQEIPRHAGAQRVGRLADRLERGSRSEARPESQPQAGARARAGFGICAGRAQGSPAGTDCRFQGAQTRRPRN